MNWRVTERRNMKHEELFERIECRRDDKARRVLNVAPSTVADITADEIESGITLERLDTLNVPVLRYSTQLTIHGKLPAFNEFARPGGYRCIIQNQNGSIGVKFSAIDAAKKELIARACQASASDWGASSTSTAFELSQTFYVTDETKRAEAKAAAIACARAVPADKFFGSVYGFCLDYGAGYGVSAAIGAIPEAEVWPLIATMLGVADDAELVRLEAEAQAADEARHAQWQIEAEVRRKVEAAKRDADLAALLPTLRRVTVAPATGEVVIVDKYKEVFRFKLEFERGRLFYTKLDSYMGRKLAKNGFPWQQSLADGRVFVPAN